MDSLRSTHNNSIELMVWGNNALFSDILTRVGGEKTSYPIPTYEALKGVLNSIYWKPTFIWVIDDVRIMNPIRYARKGIRLMKYKSTYGPKSSDLAHYTYLENPCYQIRAHFEWNRNRPEYKTDRITSKHYDIAMRSLASGGRRDIYLGTRECQAYVAPCVFGEGEGAYDNCGIIPYGTMEHGFTYPDEAVRKRDTGALTLRLWQPIMENGIIHFIRPEECTATRRIKSMIAKTFDTEVQT